ncbi:serine/threonine-protein kinase [Streptomyces griseoluteus]|uniref:serine/threonine-protein kinase n=1 Tax=Streptomyces griseoluteus TaxID=29306 RepID=UPI0036F69705
MKVIKPSVVDSETRLRFAQEVEILKAVWGARIAALLDADPDADPPWLATEYVEGLDLSRHVSSHGPLDALLTASLGATLAEALATVHKQGLLHRDLKPANVLLGPNGPKVIDFGLAVFAESSVSLTAANTVVGTPSCMPPEQANGEKPLTPAVDVYALGAVPLFAASGHAPYRADNIHLRGGAQPWARPPWHPQPACRLWISGAPASSHTGPAHGHHHSLGPHHHVRQRHEGRDRQVEALENVSSSFRGVRGGT